MPTLSTRLLHRRLFQDAVDVHEIQQEQSQCIEDCQYGKAVLIGDYWLAYYEHVPNVMILEMNSGHAELLRSNMKLGTLRMLQANLLFRKWERAIALEKIKLQRGEIVLIQNILKHACGILVDICNARGHEGYKKYLGLLLEEYENKVGDLEDSLQDLD